MNILTRSWGQSFSSMDSIIRGVACMKSSQERSTSSTKAELHESATDDAGTRVAVSASSSCTKTKELLFFDDLVDEASAALIPLLVKYHISMYSPFFMRVSAIREGMWTGPMGRGASTTGANLFLYFFRSSLCTVSRSSSSAWRLRSFSSC